MTTREPADRTAPDAYATQHWLDSIREELVDEGRSYALADAFVARVLARLATPDVDGSTMGPVDDGGASRKAAAKEMRERKKRGRENREAAIARELGGDEPPTSPLILDLGEIIAREEAAEKARSRP